MEPVDDALERQLRDALARREPSEGFAERVLAALPDRRPRPVRRAGWWMGLRWPEIRLPRWSPVLAAALMLVLVAVLPLVRERQREAEARRAAVQLVEGLRLTSARLDAVQMRLHRLNGTKQEGRL